MKNDLEVLIVGAGPTGLMIACQLALFNVSFRIIDKKVQPGSHSGAMIIHARTMEVFQQMKLIDKLLEQGTVIKGISVFFDGKLSSGLELGEEASQLSAYPFILMLEQFKTEQLLLDFLKDHGHQVEWETELVDIIQESHEVKATLRLPDSASDILRSKYLVAADGGKSRVRHLLDIPFLGKTHGVKLAVMECDADMVLPPGRICFSFSKQATTGFFPIQENKWRIDAALRHMKIKHHQLDFEKVQNVFNRKTKIIANIRNVQWFSVFHSHGRYATQFRVNRCFLAGDAAHLFTPVGGQGMNTGLQDAVNLAWKLALVLKNRLVPQALDTYETERKPIAVSICRESDRFFKLAASGKLHFQILRRIFLPSLLKFLFRMLKKKVPGDYIFKKISGIGLNYPLNILNTDTSKDVFVTAPQPGHRLPFIQYSENGKIFSIQQKVDSTRFLLLIFGDRTNSGILLNAVQDFRDILTPVVLPFGEGTSDLYLHLGIKSEGWYLVRPDMYIACSSDEPGAEELKAYLHTLFIKK